MINRKPITVLTEAKMLQLGMNQQEIIQYFQHLPPIGENISEEVIPVEIKEVETIIEPVVESPVELSIKPSVKEKKPRKPYTYTKKKKDRKRKFHFPEHWNDNLITKWRHYYYRSLKKQMEFSLTHQEFEEFFLNKECVYCGDNDNITIDRINSSKGYTISNTQPCCNTCNVLKFYLSEKAFLKQVNKIYNHLNTM